MASGEAKTISQLHPKASLSFGDLFVIASGSNNYSVNTAVLFQSFNLNPSNPPANSSSNGTPGQLAWDSGHLYLCVANNTWIRFLKDNAF